MATTEPGPQQRTYRAPRANGHSEGGSSTRRAHHANRRWVADGRGGASTSHAGSDTERWERGAHRGGGRGRSRGGRGKFGNTSVTFRRNGALDGGTTGSEGEHSELDEEYQAHEVDPSEPDTPEERESFWQELVKARELERKKAIAEGKMDDPHQPKRLEDAITMTGTCTDMCPRFERYRRERENNLFEWEMIPGTKRVDHKRAVKAYERAAGDKTLPSDLRPPDVLKRTLDYLFHELLPRGGFSETFNFIRDRSRAVRNDFTMQHDMGPVAIECHGRCARFHILALHVERDRPGFSIAMEEQQLMNTLQSLKEFYLDQRGHYQSPTELEMRVYHRLIHIRDQKERHDDIPQALLGHPVFKLTTRFRARVQAKSAPITKTSPLAVDLEAMQIFGELADVLRREGNVVMTYLVACILERHFGKDTIEDIESIRGDLSFSDVIDGYIGVSSLEHDTDIDISVVDETEDRTHPPVHTPPHFPRPLLTSGTQWLTDTFGPGPTQSTFSEAYTTDPPPQPSAPPVQSAFSNLKTTPHAFGTTPFVTQSTFTNVGPTTPVVSVFGQTTRENSSIFTPTLLPHRVSETSSTRIGTLSSPSGSPFPPVVPTPIVDPPTTFTPHAEWPLQTPALYPQQAPHLNAFTSDGGQKPMSDSEASPSRSLNPLAPTFIPKPNFATSTASVSTPPSSLRTSVDNFQPSILFPGTKQSSLSTSPQPAREQPTSHAVVSEMSFVLSPPSVDSPLGSGMDQTPLLQPPPLNRRQLISLPSTPTAALSISSFLPAPRKPSPKNLQTVSISAAPTEILSPLVLHSPVSRSSVPGLFRRESIQSPLKTVVNAADLEAEAEPSVENLDRSLVAAPLPVRKPSLDIMKATALHFARRGWLVKQMFFKWRQRLQDQVEWLEACRRSVRYKEKAQADRLSRSVGDLPTMDGHAHQRTPSETRVPLKKRLRERLSGEYQPPANDEELARRFEKNHEDHARRWARGSFLAVVKDFLNSTSKPLPDNWSAWLSLNQESDGTAIWLEQKFSVPESGKWENENVFHIPISTDGVDLERLYPGVVIFERTPLTGVVDILGRKYRVLEDCTRLREIIEAFPAGRQYVPALLCIAWSERDPSSSKDFDDMVQSMVEGGMLTSVHELVISTTALDMESKLEELVRVVPFDLEGRLVKHVSLNDLFKKWEPYWEEVTTRWLGNCTICGEFNWDLYAKLLDGCIRFMIRIIDSVTNLLRDDGDSSDLAHLQLGKSMDSDTTFDTVIEWLETLPRTEFTTSLTSDVRTHQNLGREFPTLTFQSQLYALARSVAAHIANVHPETVQTVSQARLDDASREVQKCQVAFEEMKFSDMGRLKPSKRLASFTETGSTGMSTPRSKKQRLSLSEGSPSDEEMTSPVSVTSPSLSTATSVVSEPAQQSVVTPAMLRSLTKDVRAKYGVAPDTLFASR